MRKICYLFFIALGMIVFNIRLISAEEVEINVTQEEIENSGFYLAVQHYLIEARDYASEDNPYVINVEPGEYKVSHMINVYSNTTLHLDGVTLIRDDGFDGNVIFIGGLDEAQNGVLGYYYSNIVLNGGILDGSGGSKVLLKIGHAHNITVNNMTLRNEDNGHMVETNTVDGLTISKCKFENQIISEKAAEEKGSYVYEAIQLDISVGEHVTGYRSEPLASKNITISDCEFSNVIRGIGSHTGILNAPMENITIEGCTFNNLASSAIELVYSKDVTIINNIMTDVIRGIYVKMLNENGNGVYLSTYLAEEGNTDTDIDTSFKAIENANLLISGNVIVLSENQPVYDSSSKAGVFIVGRQLNQNNSNSDGSGNLPLGNYYYGGIVIANNRITTTGYGIRIADCRDGEIINNPIDYIYNDNDSESTYRAIYIADQSEGISVIDNMLYPDNEDLQSFQHGIFITDSETDEISGNVINHPATHGIYLYNSTSSLISGNTIQSALGAGIYLNNSSQADIIESNTITEAGSDGIYLYTNSIVNEIRKNTIQDVEERYSIYLSNNSYAERITENEISGSSSVNISLNTASAGYIDRNTISGGTDGIRILNSDSSYECNIESVSNNTILNVTNNGISLMEVTTADMITDNHIENSGGNGIYLRGTVANVVSGNAINTPTTNGLNIYLNSHVDECNSNKIYNAAKYGIYVNSSSSCNLIEENEIDNAGSDGIYLYLDVSAEKINNNKISNVSSRYSIYLSGNVFANEISENEISGSSSVNISLNTASAGYIDRNTISGGTDGIRILNSDSSYECNIESVSNNTILNVTNNGISLMEVTTADMITDNHIENSGGNGIYLRGTAANAVSGNVILQPGNDGINIYAKSSVGDCLNNEIDGAGRYGIFYNSASGNNLKYNTALNCTKKNISISSDSSVSDIYFNICLQPAVTVSSAVNETGGIRLLWQKATGMKGYFVLRKLMGQWDILSDIDNVSTVSYLDSEVVWGDEYQYSIAGYTNDGAYITDYRSSGIDIVSEYGDKVSVSNGSKVTVVVGEVLKLVPEISGDLLWTSKNEDVATVTRSGAVRGIKSGNTVITLKDADGNALEEYSLTVLFIDVTNSKKYFFTPVYWALENDITTGTSNRTFEPDSACTREQIVVFLWRLMGCPEPEHTEYNAYFTDVKANKYYVSAVNWAYENNITTGLNDGTGRFGVGVSCAREMVVTFLWRTAGCPEPQTISTFTDVANSKKYYYKAVSWALENGVTTGLNDGTGRFGVGTYCSRAMIVTFLYRYAHLSD